MKNNQESNYKILDILEKYIEDYPDLRFTQIMVNSELVEPISFTEGWKDEYYLENEKLLSRLEETRRLAEEYENS